MALHTSGPPPLAHASDMDMGAKVVDSRMVVLSDLGSLHRVSSEPKDGDLQVGRN